MAFLEHETRNYHRLEDQFGRPSRLIKNDHGPDSTHSIRLQDYVDDDVSSILSSPTQIQNKIKHVQDLILADAMHSFAEFNSEEGRDKMNVTLYPRYWIKRKGSNNVNELEQASQYECPSPSKEYQNIKQQQQSSLESNSDRKATNSTTCTNFTVAQFNLLAKGLSSGPNAIVPTPFPPVTPLTKDGSYGGFTNILCPEIVMDFDRVRKWRLLKVLLGGGVIDDTIISDSQDGLHTGEDVVYGDGCENANSHNDNVDGMSSSHDEQNLPVYDILALEEVDEYDSFFRPLLVNNDKSSTKKSSFPRWYRGVFQPKPSSPCVRLGWYSDGVALLWNLNKFETIPRPHPTIWDHGDDSESWIERGAFSSSTELDFHNQVYIIVPLRMMSTNKIIVVAATHLKAKKSTINEQIRESQALELRLRVEQVVSAVKNLGWDDVGILILGDFNSEPSDSSVQSILQHVGSTNGANNEAMPCNFQSAYSLQSAENNLYTTWKTRKDGTSRRIIDYIFYSTDQGRSEESADKNDICCTHVLSVPNKDEVEESLLPGFRYPSDHLLIAAKFQF